MQKRDQIASQQILGWMETRKSNKVAWKKVSSLAALFGIRRLTASTRERITLSLQSEGVELATPLDGLGPNDTVHFKREGIPCENTGDDELISFSNRLPNQIIAWDAMNIDEEADDCEQWLRCLKNTERGDRQFVWEASGRRSIVGIVTFSGRTRNKGVHEGWGIHQTFERPITRDDLLAHPATARRFGTNGIKAFQGNALRLSEEESSAICELVGGLNPTPIPKLSPDTSEPVVPWTRANGLPAEKFIENAIRDTPRLQRALGLAVPPSQQVHCGKAGRADLIAESTVIEVKKAVTIDNGPDQIERYLRFLSSGARSGKKRVRGILVQNNPWPASGVRERLLASPYPIELWAIFKDGQDQWKSVRVV